MFQPQIDNRIWNSVRQKGHPVKWIPQYSLDSERKNYLVLLSLHFKVSTVTKELKIAFLLYIKASKDVSADKFSLIIPEMLRFYGKSTYY